MKSMTELAHAFLIPVLHNQAICIDATLGQGADTAFFLSSHVRQIFAFEVQQQLIDQARNNFQDSSCNFLHTGHEQMLETLSDYKAKVDAIIFNFGWDPAQRQGVMTNPETSVTAVLQALELLRIKGRMALVFYPHPSGKTEEAAVMAALKETKHQLDLLVVRHPFKDNAPCLCLIEKRRHS